MLWKEIIDNMFMLWALAEDDLLYAEQYKLTDTGQGYNPLDSASDFRLIGRISSFAKLPAS
jgi:hypothetical protein